MHDAAPSAVPRCRPTTPTPSATTSWRIPLPFHAALRDAGPVVYLTRYDVYAMARYEQVHAALVDWQEFQSAAGVGLSNFRYEKPWRPPSLLLEADPPHHDAPRRVLRRSWPPARCAGCASGGCRRRRPRRRGARRATAGRVDAVPTLAEAFPLRVFPDAVGLPQEDRENLLA